MKISTLCFVIPAMVMATFSGCKYVQEDHFHYADAAEAIDATSSGDDGTVGEWNGEWDTDFTGEEFSVEEYTSYLPDCQEVVPLEDLLGPNADIFSAETELRGILFYVEMTPAQRFSADAGECQFFYEEENYVLGGGPEVIEKADDTCPNWALNVRVVVDGGERCADTGKVELAVVGQSTWRTWAEIPSLKLNVGTFQPMLRLSGGHKNVRLNNGQADAGVVREPVALAVWNAMGYPSPRSIFVRAQSNIWDTEFWVGAWTAYVLRQQYKGPFFSEHYSSVHSVWEGVGDPFSPEYWWDAECQWSDGDSCDDEAFGNVVQVVQEAPFGEGFMSATMAVVDWKKVQQFQCLSYITGTGDDWIHNTNNVVIALGSDGRIFFLPYSVDISADHAWYQNVQYDGIAYLTVGCAEDSACRLQSLERCLGMIDTFDVISPTTIVDERCDMLQSLGLTRSRDAKDCVDLQEFYGERAKSARKHLMGLLKELEVKEKDLK